MVQTNATTANSRLLSLDIFRGITVAAMILVNNPGDWGHIYTPLKHSTWNGCNPTDLIFPFFLFIVGVSIVYAMETKAAIRANHSKIILMALRRSAILIVISLVTQLLFHPGFAHLRYMGVLQRIGLVYFFCTILYLKTSQKTRDWVMAILLIGYYILLNFVPVPDTGHASLEPATNMGAWLDRTIFTTSHLWMESRTWDPEGLLGTLPAIVTGLISIRAGSWLKRKDRDDSIKITWLLTYSIISIVAGLFWGLFFPINKALWTSSYVLYSGGWAMASLGVCYWLIDVQGYKKYTAPFVAFGVNALPAYILSNYIPHYLINKPRFEGQTIYQMVYAPYFPPYVASVISAAALVLLIWSLMWILHLRKIIIKV